MSSSIRPVILAASFLVLVLGCDPAKKSSDAAWQQVLLHVPNTDDIVDLATFTLLTRDLQADSAAAVDLIRVKRAWPMAMHTRKAVDFDRILAKGFVFRGEDEFFDRASYINDRVNGLDTVGYVGYENVVLQFINDVGLLTYRNVVTSQDSVAYPREYMSWADVFVKEDDVWKVGASHTIEYREQ